MISAGGTISQSKDEYGTAITDDTKNAEEFAKFLEKRAETWGLAVKITPQIISNKDSSNILPEDWTKLIDTIYEKYDEFDSFLITHGTNTLGYTSAALAYALGKLGKRVILTGSQVSYDEPGSDALMNLENAIRVAIEIPEHELAGVMAVFGSHIITGVRVKKTTEFEYDAFKSFSNTASLGRIGRVIKLNSDSVENHMKWLEPRARNKKELEIKKVFEMDRIASLTEFPGMSSTLFENITNDIIETEAGNEERQIKGLILRSTGAGDPNVVEEDENEKFKNLRDGFKYLKENEIPIVITTQAPDGVASMDVNSPGKIAFDLGAIPAWDMSIEAMTVKLAWLLGRKFPYDEIRTLMTQPFRGEISEKRIKEISLVKKFIYAFRHFC